MNKMLGAFVGSVAALALVGASAAWAESQSHSVRMRLEFPVVVNGKTLPAGSYTFAWKGNGPEIDVAVKRKGKVVVETKARLADEGKHWGPDSVLTRSAGSGAPILEEVRTHGGQESLVFGPKETSESSAAQGARMAR